MSVGEHSESKRGLLNLTVKRVCRRFSKIGYNKVWPVDFWEYLENYRWRKTTPETFFDKRRDILSITANEFFDYQVIKASTKRPQDFDWENIDDLL